jgi:hypothetical protein
VIPVAIRGWRGDQLVFDKQYEFADVAELKERLPEMAGSHARRLVAEGPLPQVMELEFLAESVPERRFLCYRRSIETQELT